MQKMKCSLIDFSDKVKVVQNFTTTKAFFFKTAIGASKRVATRPFMMPFSRPPRASATIKAAR